MENTITVDSIVSLGLRLLYDYSTLSSLIEHTENAFEMVADFVKTYLGRDFISNIVFWYYTPEEMQDFLQLTPSNTITPNDTDMNGVFLVMKTYDGSLNIFLNIRPEIINTINKINNSSIPLKIENLTPTQIEKRGLKLANFIGYIETVSHELIHAFNYESIDLIKKIDQSEKEIRDNREEWDEYLAINISEQIAIQYVRDVLEYEIELNLILSMHLHKRESFHKLVNQKMFTRYDRARAVGYDYAYYKMYLYEGYAEPLMLPILSTVDILQLIDMGMFSDKVIDEYKLIHDANLHAVEKICK